MFKIYYSSGLPNTVRSALNMVNDELRISKGGGVRERGLFLDVPHL